MKTQTPRFKGQHAGKTFTLYKNPKNSLSVATESYEEQCLYLKSY